MDFTEKELEQIKYALEYLHDGDLSDFGDDNIEALESAMNKLGMEFSSQLWQIKQNKKREIKGN